jgi:hypothetical protein
MDVHGRVTDRGVYAASARQRHFVFAADFGSPFLALHLDSTMMWWYANDYERTIRIG